MLFNSLDFAIFLPIVFVLYWFVCHKNLKLQNLLILVSSYIFYGWWDWRFLSLIAFSTLVDYIIGVLLSKEERPRKRKLLLFISIFINLGFLGFFKYYNFFLESFVDAYSFFGQSISVSSLNIILPVGISFYTFQTMSYTIDVYKRKLEPTKYFISFGAFVSFFPQLVAGPIERASNLLPQFYKHRVFNYPNAVNGMRQILWGLFKKIVIADNCAYYANMIFNNSDSYSGSTLFVGAVFFAFQIYGDFSGYSDIAIGVSRLFGFNLMQNFAFPYFSKNFGEFWRRWHISLSTWFRDYLYIPLGGSRGDFWFQLRNTMIIFVVSGFWHGANWTFVAWGFVNALLFLPILLSRKNKVERPITDTNKTISKLKSFGAIVLTFTITCLVWVFFRAENIGHAFAYLSGIFSKSLFTMPTEFPLKIIAVIIMFMTIEWFGRRGQYGIETIGLNWHKSIRMSFYMGLCVLIFLLKGTQQEFIYFQF
ncbi:MAG: MBOAT family O-acyltransferase [Gelidibacter sp.]